MKKILLLILFPVLSFGQASQANLTKVKASVKKYLSLTMNDFKSYEPVQWSTLNAVYTSFEDSEDSRMLKELMIDNAKQAAPFKKIADSYVATWGLEEAKKNKAYQDNTDSATKYMELSNTAKKLAIRKYKDFKPQFLYYTITHRFRGKNSMGALIINEKTFFLNKQLGVIKCSDVDDND